jgi:recombination protein RecA
MPSAATLRLQIETALASRIPSALTPAPRVIRLTAPTGIPALDDALSGGLPIGAITELAGLECSGRTSLALSFVAGLTQAARVCAWVDVSDTLHPESAAAIGVDLNRLLWIRCGPEPQQLTLPGISRENPQQNQACEHEAKQPPVEGKQISAATKQSVPVRMDPRCAEPVPKVRRNNSEVATLAPPVRHASDRYPDPLNSKLQTLNSAPRSPEPGVRRPVLPQRKPWSRLDQALRATDLLLQAGGFSAIVLDMGSVAPEFALRVPLATWFRYRAAAERTHASVLLLTQHACSKSSAGLVLHCQPGEVYPESTTIFTGAEHRIEITRERFAKVVDFDRRKPPQSDYSVHHPTAPKWGASGTSVLWQTRTPWAAVRPAQPQKSGRR